MIGSITTVVLITACGMWGGQQNKWVRRYLLPFVVLGYTVAKNEKKKWKALYYLTLIGVLSMGYGEHSKLRKLFNGNDALTRIAYGILVSLPFVFFGKWWAIFILPIAFSIRAGGFQITKTKDFLWEDFIRYTTVGMLVVI